MILKGSGSDDETEGSPTLPRFQPWETLLFSTRPHPKSFSRLWIAYGLLTALWIFVLVVVVLAFRISVYDRAFWWFFIIAAIAFAAVIYGEARAGVDRNRRMVYICNFWVISFVITMSVLLMKMIHTELAATQREWWEELIGIPFSLASIVFSLLIFIVSRVVWRIAYLTPKPYSFPLYVSSISLVAVSLYSLVFARQFDLLASPETLQYLFIGFSLVTIIFGLFIVAFINHKGGLRYMMSTKRLVIVSDFLKNSVEDHLFDKIHEVEFSQSYIGRKHDYGDLKIRMLCVIETPKGEKIHKRSVLLNGMPSPMLMKNTMLALSSGESSKSQTFERQKSRVPEIVITQEVVSDDGAKPVVTATVMPQADGKIPIKVVIDGKRAFQSNKAPQEPKYSRFMRKKPDVQEEPEGKEKPDRQKAARDEAGSAASDGIEKTRSGKKKGDAEIEEIAVEYEKEMQNRKAE